MDKITRKCPQTRHNLFGRETEESRSGVEPRHGPFAYQPQRLTARPNRLSHQQPRDGRAIKKISPFLTGRMFVRPNILRTLRRTMIRFLIEHLVRRIWFGQSRLYFILLACNEMQASARTCGRRAADSMIENVG